MWPEFRGIGLARIVGGLLGLSRGRTYRPLAGPQTKGRVLTLLEESGGTFSHPCYHFPEASLLARKSSPWACKLRMSGKTARHKQKAGLWNRASPFGSYGQMASSFSMQLPSQSCQPSS